MKNNIDLSQIHNRKVIIELRYNPVPKFLDLKGSIIEKIDELKIINGVDWSIGDSAIKVADNRDDKLVRNIIQIEINRLSFISSKIDSIEKFVSDFMKVYDLVSETLDKKVKLSRIGCRIQGTYKTKSTDYKDILENFKKAFPNQIFLEDFPTQDLRLQIVYQNGTYHTGPVKENDPFLIREFQYPERKNNVGIGLDTDNYLLSTSSMDITNKTKIKDVITASLAVEKNLVEKLKNF